MAAIQISPQVRAQLTEYYMSAESALGMRSSFGVLVDAALGGWSSNGDHDRAIVRRHQLGPTASTPVSRAREVRAWLIAIGSKHESALDAVFGMTDWPHTVDNVFGRGMGIKVTKALGELVGVALLTEAVRKGYERERDRKASLLEVPATVHLRSGRIDAYVPGKAAVSAGKARPWDTPGGWLVTLCLHKDKQLDAVTKEAEAMVRAALFAFGAEAGVEPFVAAEPKVRGVRMPRPARHVDPIRVWESK